MVVIILGLVISYGGFGAIIFGVYLNNNIGARLNSWLNSVVNHTIDTPGTVFIIAGIVAVLVGTVAIVVMARRFSKRRYY